MSTAHATPAPKKRRKNIPANPRARQEADPPFELKTERAKVLWDLRCKARRAKNFKPLSTKQIEDLIDEMRG
ncbi:MAG: hypothetical protein KBG84_15570 [Planctomycetes bacterium]|nr:hypothetical protein [Planctomycetota bacterium]